MLDKVKVVEFFDRLAPSWDQDCTPDSNKINSILDYAGIKAGVSVLDVACGTGVLFPFYLERAVNRITGVDISKEMIAESEKKYTSPHIRLLCADIETVEFETLFDCCVVFNAFPHFGNPSLLIERLAAALRPGGRLTIAHSDSIDKINHRHMHHASAVSVDLLPVEKLSELFAPLFEVDVSVADENIYALSGVKQ